MIFFIWFFIIVIIHIVIFAVNTNLKAELSITNGFKFQVYAEENNLVYRKQRQQVLS